jgi:hypothetical protein
MRSASSGSYREPRGSHDDSAITWHDVADQLTPGQIERLTGMEQRSQLPADETAESLLAGAREWAQSNLNDRVMFGHVASPADAVRRYHREDDGEGPLDPAL